MRIGSGSLVVVVLTLVQLAGCSAQTKTSDVDAGGTCIMGAVANECPAVAPTFSGDVIPIINARCTSCHSEANDAGLWPLTDWQTISDWRASILDVLRSCDQPPKTSGQALTRSERETIEGWIACGAQNS